MKWVGNVALMGERSTYRVLMKNPKRKDTNRKINSVQEDNIKVDFKVIVLE